MGKSKALKIEICLLDLLIYATEILADFTF